MNNHTMENKLKNLCYPFIQNRLCQFSSANAHREKWGSCGAFSPFRGAKMGQIFQVSKCCRRTAKQSPRLALITARQDTISRISFISRAETDIFVLNAVFIFLFRSAFLSARSIEVVFELFYRCCFTDVGWLLPMLFYRC